MRSTIYAVTVIFLGATAASADEKATALVKKAIEAHGGAAALDKYKAGKFAIKGDMAVMGLDLKFTGQFSYMLPDRFRMEMEADVMGMKMNISQAIKGDVIKGKVVVGGMTVPLPEESKTELAIAAAMQDAERLTPLLDAKKYEIKTGEDEDVGGAKTETLLIKVKSLDRDVKFNFDKKTSLLVKTTHKGKSIEGAGKEVLEESILSDYKKVKGIQVPTKMVTSEDGKKVMTGEMTDIELFEKLDDKEFTVDD